MTHPRVNGIMETSLYVADLDASQAFYQRLFGFELFLSDQRMRTLGVPGGQVLLLFRRGGSVQPSPAPGGMIPAHDAHGQQHLCFAIPWMALADWERHLREQGVELESRVNWPGRGSSLYFRDPDGHSVEVATPGLWPNL
jgi:catechol 2,3-dioxygenase-like lactoylglutathione lyase family enzyme